MTIARHPFGRVDGADVSSYTITNARGCKARLIDFGARLVEFHAPGRDGRLADVVLGFDDLAGYAATKTYFGATCGRYANRIANGTFTLGDTAVHVTANEGANHLHGGLKGFDKHVWHAAPDEAANAVTFSLVSPDGDEGFPGALLVKATYALTDDNRLAITLSGATDRPTVLNMVNHAYWNAAGHASGDLLEQVLTVEADFYTPVDDELLATGEILKVAGTPFDFRRPEAIGAGLAALLKSGRGAGGYDHNWVLRAEGPGLRPVATLFDPASGRGFTLRASEPGVQIYTGGSLDGSEAGKGGVPYQSFAGLTFETQKFPGSPNFAHFPSARLEPGAVYEHRMEFQFFTR